MDHKLSKSVGKKKQSDTFTCVVCRDIEKKLFLRSILFISYSLSAVRIACGLQYFHKK